MRRRRTSPYSQVEALRRSRRELLALVLLTLGLGLALNLLADVAGECLAAWAPWPAVGGALLLLLVLGLAALAVGLFYARSESRWLPIEIWLPYHLPADGQPTIARRGSYGVTVHARRAFTRRYARNSPELRDWLAAWRQAQETGTPFQQLIARDNAALVQCLALYVLHRYGDESLGPEAVYGWQQASRPARPRDALRLTMDDLPPGLRDNPFLRADQRAEAWRLWWPAEVQIELQPDPDGQNPFPRWRLKHRRFGYVEIRWSPHLSVAGRGSQVWRVLTQRLKLDRRSQLFVVGTRLEARACFRWTFWPGDDAFHDWAAGLLAYLEEALDWGYYLHTRTDRLVALLDERIGWLPEGASLWDKLQEIEGRLARLEVQDAQAATLSSEMEDDSTEGEALVV